MEILYQSKGLIGLLALIVISSELVHSCTISSGWTSLRMNERLLLSDIVVYGRTTQHKANVRKIGKRTIAYIDAIFEVFCVIKQAEDPIPEEITIERISPRDGCSGTKDFMQIQQEAIVALRRTPEGNYKYHEVVPTLSATFLPTRATLFSIAGICDLQRWVPPLNATENRCPVCGQAKFTDDLVAAGDSSAALTPCIVNGKIQVDSNGCEMFTTKTYDNTSICLPSNFDVTCTRLVYAAPTASCECNDMSKIFHANFGDVGTGATILPSLSAILFTLFVALLSA